MTDCSSLLMEKNPRYVLCHKCLGLAPLVAVCTEPALSLVKIASKGQFWHVFNCQKGNFKAPEITKADSEAGMTHRLLQSGQRFGTPVDFNSPRMPKRIERLIGLKNA